MDIEYDTDKDGANLIKHGHSLLIGRIVLENAIGDVLDPRDYGGEERRAAYGLVNGRLLMCVYTLRGSTYRVISVRKANKREQRKWLSLS